MRGNKYGLECLQSSYIQITCEECSGLGWIPAFRLPSEAGDSGLGGGSNLSLPR